MINPSEVFPRWLNSLRIRMVALLSVALLPVGLIAVNQTATVTANAKANAELALRLRTEQAAYDERLVVRRAFGAAEAMVPFVDYLDENPDECVPLLSQVADQSTRFSWAGIIPVSGQLTCSSAGVDYTMSPDGPFPQMVVNARPAVTVNEDAPLSGTSVITVMQPYFRAGTIAGFVAVSIPHQNLPGLRTDESDNLRDLITFNSDGDVLTANRDMESVDLRLPKGVNMASLTGQGVLIFDGENNEGDMRIFAVVPIDQSSIYVLGIWDPTANSSC